VAYESKQREVLGSDANLLELDLLRGGRRILPDLGLEMIIERLEPLPTYVVLANRAWRRGIGVDYDLYSIGLRGPLPCIAGPLKEGEDEIALDLQDFFDRAYDTGPFSVERHPDSLWLPNAFFRQSAPPRQIRPA
jgi:Protein of unknown function (DUF4058)